MNELTDNRILPLLAPVTLDLLDVFETFHEVESTNSYLLEQHRPAVGRIRVALANHQTASRGQFGRRWISGPAAGIYLSVAYSFAESPSNFSCLTLATGIGIADALAGIQISGVSIKWPNDLILNGRKAGGILTEVVPGKSESTTVVIGVGLNVDLGALPCDVDSSDWVRGATDLRSSNPDLPEPVVVAAALVNGLHKTLCDFERDGFRPFMTSWNQLDWLRGKRAVVERSDNSMSGTVMGIGNSGELMLATDNGVENIVSGSVRLLAQSSVE